MAFKKRTRQNLSTPTLNTLQPRDQTHNPTVTESFKPPKQPHGPHGYSYRPVFLDPHTHIHTIYYKYIHLGGPPANYRFQTIHCLSMESSVGMWRPVPEPRLVRVLTRPISVDPVCWVRLFSELGALRDDVMDGPVSRWSSRKRTNSEKKKKKKEGSSGPIARVVFTVYELKDCGTNLNSANVTPYLRLSGLPTLNRWRTISTVDSSGQTRNGSMYLHSWW